MLSDCKAMLLYAAQRLRENPLPLAPKGRQSVAGGGATRSERNPRNACKEIQSPEGATEPFNSNPINRRFVCRELA